MDRPAAPGALGERLVFVFLWGFVGFCVFFFAFCRVLLWFGFVRFGFWFLGFCRLLNWVLAVWLAFCLEFWQ